MSFKTEIEDYLGVTFSDTDALDNWASTGARIYVDRASVQKELSKYATNLSDAGSGISILGGRAISAHKSNYPALRIPAEDKAKYGDANSIFQAVATSPVWYIELQKGFVLPAGGTVRHVAYPAVDTSTSSISDFPPEGYAVFVLYAAMQAQINLIATLLATTMAGISYSDAAPPSAPSAPSFTWVDAVTGTYTPTSLADTAITPTYTKPTVSLTAAPSDFVIGDIVPSAPAAPSFAYTPATKVDAAALGLLDISTEIGELAVFLDTKHDPELSLAKLKEIDTLINEYGLEKVKAQDTLISNAQSEADINKVNAIQDLLEQVKEYDADLQKFAHEVANYQAQLQQETTVYSNNLQKWAQERATDLQEYSSDIQNELNEFNKELVIYQGMIQQEIEQARLTQEQVLKEASDTTELNKFNELQTLAEQVQEYQAELGKFQAEIQLYAAEVAAEVQRIQTIIGQYTSMYQGYSVVLEHLRKEYNRLLETI